MLKLDDLMARVAKHVLVLGIAVIMLVIRARAEIEAPKKARVDELAESAINGRPAHAKAGVFHLVDQLVGVEVIMLAEDKANHVALLTRVALRPRPRHQILPKFFFGRLGNFN